MIPRSGGRPILWNTIPGSKARSQIHLAANTAHLWDAAVLAERSAALLRQALCFWVDIAVDIKLDLAYYLQNRGVKYLNFKPEQEFKDPYQTQELLTPAASLGLPSTVPDDRLPPWEYFLPGR